MTAKSFEDFDKLLALYGKRKHPLDYANRYQLIVMVILSARDSDRHINTIAPRLFKDYPTLTALAAARMDDLLAHIGEVTNGANKGQWLLRLAKSVGSDEQIPTKLDALIELPGIGRKSANVIIRESGGEAEGIIVDLHVIRTAPRIGIATGAQPEKIEKQLMGFFPKKLWNEAGMALSFLGREICRPSNPKCEVCPVNGVCDFCQGGKAGTQA
ncbi:MAG: endonuclease III [Treponemataceae bacterium]